MIVLIGFMGAGKTTIGRLVSQRIGLPFIDTDSLIEARAGRSIPQIFTEDGERAFRELEREVVAEALAGESAVVALGGGAVEDPTTAATIGWYDVFYLEVPYSDAMRRIGVDPGRPMLMSADPRALYQARRPLYESLGKHRIDTVGRDLEDVAEEVLKTVSPRSLDDRTRRIRVPLGKRSYEITVGANLLDDLEKWWGPTDAEVAFLITHPSLEGPAQRVAASLKRCGSDVWIEYVPEGEASKSLTVASKMYEEMANAGVHRSDLVVSVGGGVVGDLAGYVAATYHRGVAILQVPTTLLSQVDAAIGGKTAVNLPQGKNLVGAIHQPTAVICDVAALGTLPLSEIRSGMAEVMKYGFIVDPSLLEWVVARWDGLVDRDPDLLIEVVGRSAAIKAEVVGSDERETSRRAILNYGHTFGHAIEQVMGQGRIRHGEAISLGMMAAAYLANDLGMIDAEAVGVHRSVLAAIGLPVSAELDLGALERAWSHDKKYRRGMRFVLLAGLGRAEFGIEAPRDALERTISRLRR